MCENILIFTLLVVLKAIVATQDDVCGPSALTVTGATVETFQAPKNNLNVGDVCTYVITGDPNKLVNITFTAFPEQVAKAACTKASVKIEGIFDNVKTDIATICSKHESKIFYSTGSKLMLTLKALAEVAARSITANYQSVDVGESFCGQQKLLAKSNEAIQWNEDGNKFKDGKICVYFIKAQPGEVVQLTFKRIPNGPNFVNAEQGGAEQAICDKPLIRLENFISGEQSQIAEFCPNGAKDAVYTSTTQEMIVTINGTSTGDKAIFNAEYKSIPEPDCGLTILKTAGDSLKSWNIPLQTLTTEKVCTYMLEGEPEQLVQLNITAFDRTTTQKSATCDKPYLNLEDVVDNEKTTIANICDDQFPKSFTSVTSKMAISLYGINQMKEHAVKMMYQAVPAPDICGTLSLTAETSLSSEWKAPAHNMLTAKSCAYTIESKDNRPIELAFLTLDVGVNETKCNVPYVKIQEVDSSSRTKDIATLCGQHKNLKYTSTTPKMIVTLEGAKGLKKESFTATYKTAFAMRIQFGLIIPLLTSLSVFINF